MTDDLNREGGSEPKTAMCNDPDNQKMNAREVEYMVNEVADKALERIVKRVKWPFLIAAALATYTGYNVWNDLKSRTQTFHETAEKKLKEIDENANQRLSDKLESVINSRKADISELTNQLRKDSAAALVEAERAQAASKETSGKIQQQATESIAQINRQAEATIAELQAKLKEVEGRRDLFVQQIEIFERDISRQNQRLTEGDQSKPSEGLLGQKAFALIGVKAAQELGLGQPVTVAILATGVSKFPTTANAETLEGRIIHEKSFVEGESTRDGNGQGTLVASLVTNIAPTAKVVSVKVLSDGGSGPDGGILAGLNYAMEVGARIVILPVGSNSKGARSVAYTNAFTILKARGILVFAAAGNNGPVNHPGNCPPALAIAATDLQDKRALFSSVGPEIALAGPGTDIVAIGLDGKYKSYSGTSFSTAIVGSVAALILSIRPELTADDVESILKQSAKKLDLKAKEVGAGRVDALAAVRLAKSYNAPKQ